MADEDQAWRGRIDEATKLRSGFEEFRKQVLADERLTPEGKQDTIAERAAQINPKLAELRRQHVEAPAEERDRLLRSLYSPPSDSQEMVLWRDGLDRAERAKTAGELERIYDRAAEVGDQQQLRAAVYVALQRGVRGVLDAHARRDPKAKEVLDRLEELGQWQKRHMRLEESAFMRVGR